MLTESGTGWTLHNCDCLRWMAEQGEASVDHVICDPPYDERTHTSALCGSIGDYTRHAGRGVRFAATDPTTLAPALVRIAERWAIAFCSTDHLGTYATAAGDAWVRAGVWDKVAPSPSAAYRASRAANSIPGACITPSTVGSRVW